jgi:outer membrane lipoprotein LolB
MIKRIVVAVLVTVAISGCASNQLRDPSNSAASQELWQGRQAKLETIKDWDIKGRLGVRTEDDGGSATLIWDRRGENHVIELYGPFGGGRVHIEQNPQGATMQDNKKVVYEDVSASALLYRRIGWHVPFDSLTYWLRGLPEPGLVAGLTLDSDGRVIGFQQHGWEISMVDYNTHQGIDLPRKIFIKASPGTVHLVDDDGKDLGDKLEVKVILKRWLVIDS